MFAVFLEETSELGASHRPASPQLLEGSVVTIIIAAQGSREVLRSSASEPSPLYWGATQQGPRRTLAKAPLPCPNRELSPTWLSLCLLALGRAPYPLKSTGTFWGPLLRGGSRPSEQRTRVGSQVSLSAVGCVTTLSSPLPWTE